MSALKDSLSKNIKSYRYAGKGMLHVLIFENNVKYQVIAAIAVIALSILLAISKMEWIVVIVMIGFVFVAELFNTALEHLCNHLHPHEHTAIGLVKDIAAGAVLVAAITALITGLIIFLPKIIQQNPLF
ncbi:MAG: diacylglycerol kinase family protein [Bacteroidota bacterium]